VHGVAETLILCDVSRMALLSHIPYLKSVIGCCQQTGSYLPQDNF
jgi:hypothetical protein